MILNPPHLAVLALLATGMAAPVTQAEDYIVTTSVDGGFAEVKENIKNAIVGRGLNIANELHASDMLNRTGPDLGYPDSIYSHAETIEFCSATVSHKLVQVNIHNVVLCPFGISVYELVAEPEKVYLSYRRPLAGPESTEAATEVEDLIQGIIQDASW